MKVRNPLPKGGERWNQDLCNVDGVYLQNEWQNAPLSLFADGGGDANLSMVYISSISQASVVVSKPLCPVCLCVSMSHLWYTRCTRRDRIDRSAVSPPTLADLAPASHTSSTSVCRFLASANHTNSIRIPRSSLDLEYPAWCSSSFHLTSPRSILVGLLQLRRSGTSHSSRMCSSRSTLTHDSLLLILQPR